MEQESIDKIRQGDEEAFEELFRTWYPKLCLFANQYVKSADLSRDVVQEVFIRIWNQHEEVDENGEEQPIMNWNGEPMVVIPEINQLINNDGGEAEGAMNVKYEIEPGGLSNMSNDMVIFRLADFMLMKAEALMRQNGGAATQ